MTKVLSAIGIAVCVGTLMFAFNNCGKVGFEQMAEKAASTDGSLNGTGDEGNHAGGDFSGDPAGDSPGDSTGDSPNEVTLTPEVVDSILDTLPPEELNNPRPVSDLENDPTLYDIYKCPDSDGVVICHFPENVDSQGTKCIGRPAVSTHYNHIRNYTREGEARQIGDYLGPCRIPL